MSADRIARSDREDSSQDDTPSVDREEANAGSDHEALTPAMQNPATGVWAGASLAGGSGRGSLIEEQDSPMSTMDDDDTIAQELEANGVDPRDVHRE